MMTKARVLTGIALALIVTALSLSCADSPPVRLATEGEYHPFNFVNDAGEIDGLEREMGDELCRRADLECEWVLNEWDTMIPHLRAEDFDAIVAGMSITDERDERIDFTQPYYPPAPSVYVALAEADDSAVDGTVGVFANSIYSDYLTETGAPFVTFKSSQAQIDAVLTGEVDAALVDHGYAVEKVAETGGKLAIVGPSLTLDMGLGIGVRTDSDLKAKLDEAIASMKADGTLNALILKWIGQDAATF